MTNRTFRVKEVFKIKGNFKVIIELTDSCKRLNSLSKSLSRKIDLKNIDINNWNIMK